MSADYHITQIKDLEANNTKLGGFLAVAVIALFILGGLYFSANSTVGQQAKMIDTCIEDIDKFKSKVGDANDAIDSMNDTLDSISSQASNSAGEDYYTQSSTLDDIASEASSGQSSGDYGDYSDCAQVTSSGGNSD